MFIEMLLFTRMHRHILNIFRDGIVSSRNGASNHFFLTDCVTHLSLNYQVIQLPSELHLLYHDHLLLISVTQRLRHSV